jgi:catechol 2,3-dioxygenase-like lactoylglutathione lyase family enzyme
VDHLVLTVVDVEATMAFYTGVLGMTEVTFGAGRRALAFGANKINLHERGNEFEPKAERRPASVRLRTACLHFARRAFTSHSVRSMRSDSGVCEVTAGYAK